jgi:hypothetical protein
MAWRWRRLRGLELNHRAKGTPVIQPDIPGDATRISIFRLSAKRNGDRHRLGYQRAEACR